MDPPSCNDWLIGYTGISAKAEPARIHEPCPPRKRIDRLWSTRCRLLSPLSYFIRGGFVSNPAQENSYSLYNIHPTLPVLFVFGAINWFEAQRLLRECVSATSFIPFVQCEAKTGARLTKLRSSSTRDYMQFSILNSPIRPRWSMTKSLLFSTLEQTSTSRSGTILRGKRVLYRSNQVSNRRVVLLWERISCRVSWFNRFRLQYFICVFPRECFENSAAKRARSLICTGVLNEAFS